MTNLLWPNTTKIIKKPLSAFDSFLLSRDTLALSLTVARHNRSALSVNLTIVEDIILLAQAVLEVEQHEIEAA